MTRGLQMGIILNIMLVGIEFCRNFHEFLLIKEQYTAIYSEK